MTTCILGIVAQTPNAKQFIKDFWKNREGISFSRVTIYTGCGKIPAEKNGFQTKTRLYAADKTI